MADQRRCTRTPKPTCKGARYSTLPPTQSKQAFSCEPAKGITNRYGPHTSIWVAQGDQPSSTDERRKVSRQRAVREAVTESIQTAQQPRLRLSARAEQSELDVHWM